VKRLLLPFVAGMLPLGLWLTLSAGTGAPAAAAFSGWEKIQTSTQKYNTSGIKEARCSSGKRVISGGYHMVGSNQSMGFAGRGHHVVISRPSADNLGWYVGWYADIDVGDFWVNIYAICGYVQ
jgi:hypothetical protein